MRPLPEFPWASLQPYRERATAFPGGLIDLSVGTPVDPTPKLLREALAEAADAPGYPAVAGTVALREAVTAYFTRRWGIDGVDPDGVLPLIGSKEFVAWLPTMLGLGERDTVVFPELAYPTYDIGARLAGARSVRADSVVALGPARPGLIWVNSPRNPDGQVLPAEHLAKVVAWARERGTVVASDECYLEFGWRDRPVSVLDSEVNGGSLDGVLAVHSLSKRSNLAGYRAGFVAGDVHLVRNLLEMRKHAGMIVPAPVQRTMVEALGDDGHVDEQRDRYWGRRASLGASLEEAGFRIDRSDGGLYLWATRNERCWDTVGWFADRGVLVAPGSLYGPSGEQHVRIALTAADDHIANAGTRMIK